MKHLLLLTPGFAADETDSQCIPALQVFVRKLAESKHIHISVVAVHYPHRHDRQNWNGIPVYSSFGGRWMRRLKSWWNVRKWINSIHQRHPIDIIHSFWLTDAAWLGQRMARRMKLPHIVTLMGQDVLPSNWYMRLPQFRNTPMVTLSPSHSKHFEASSGRTTDAIIPWGIDAEELPNPATDRAIDILGVGSLIALKDYTLFLQLVGQLVETKPDLSVVLIGQGPEREGLEALAGKLGIEQQVTFLGALPRHEVLEYMCRSKILLHTSKFESFGYVFLEGLACGMGIVSTPVGIAQPSARWKIGETEAALLAHLKSSMGNFKNHSSQILYPISDTIEQYLALYNSFL